ncbi:hypothetical protein IU501_35460 [Nocardia otitidiscaviarum]|uniref:hypothetical protein n=1 Tax=Nocardia otitidiscaviarum TaxID=1823 RepID=UPI0018954B7A|nr:hypothetical protein [Nocardia otitidiscaviarum]MBF6138273.1 hypothetical protein [Nocardia otitidiscaviarum]
MVAVGEQVLLVAGGISVFEVLEIVDDTTAMVQAVDEAPGRYPFPAPISHLVPAPTS